jgi:hypothetical protein
MSGFPRCFPFFEVNGEEAEEKEKNGSPTIAGSRTYATSDAPPETFR